MEPWDGPASIAFTDGIRIGAVLDRNGLRPSRYYVTKDGLVVMASEVGVLDIPPEQVLQKGRLAAGPHVSHRYRRGRIVDDEEFKERIARDSLTASGCAIRSSLEDACPSPRAVRGRTARRAAAPGGLWVHLRGSEDADQRRWPRRKRADRLDGHRHAAGGALRAAAAALQLLQAALRPGHESAGRFDPRGDHHAAETTVGPEGNLLEPGPECCRQLALPTPDPHQRRIGARALARREARRKGPARDQVADAVRSEGRWRGA